MFKLKLQAKFASLLAYNNVSCTIVISCANIHRKEKTMRDFREHVFLITGGAQGIGRGIVEYLLARNAHVVIADSNKHAGLQLAKNIDSPDHCLFIETDVSNEASASHCVAQTLRKFNRLDGLANNAGIANPGRIPIEETDLADWQRTLAVNLTGPFLMAKYAAPYLEQSRGAIVNISSTRALQSEAHTEAYSASKGGLVALTHALAISFSHRIRVNAILPGWIDVRSHQQDGSATEVPPLGIADHLQHPAGRVGIPQDVAALAAFLFSDEAGFITGQSFVVDGGMTSKMIYVE